LAVVQPATRKRSGRARTGVRIVPGSFSAARPVVLVGAARGLMGASGTRQTEQNCPKLTTQTGVRWLAPRRASVARQADETG
jgi:hypothetical protein